MNQFKEEKTKKKTASRRLPKLHISLNEQNEKALGVIFMGLSVFLLLSFISFLFSFTDDYSKVERIQGGDFVSIDPTSHQNWMGFIGSYLAYKFIYCWFGLMAFAVPFLLFLQAFSMVFKRVLLPFSQFRGLLLFSLFWVPLFISVLAKGPMDYLAGGYGVYANLWLKTMFGAPGLVIILAVSLIAFILAKYKTEQIEQWLKKSSKPETSTSKNAKSTTATTEKPETHKTEKEEPAAATKSAISTPPATEQNENSFEVNYKQENPKAETIGTEKASERQEKSSATPAPERQSDVEVEGLEIEKAVTEEKLTHFSHDDNDYDPTLDLSNYKYPTLELLTEYEVDEQTINPKELEERKDLIVTTLANYKIDIDKIKATIGPTVTLFEIIPAPGVRISKIKNLEDDIALSLAALGIRIIAPIPGKGTIGIEVPNVKAEMVTMRDVISSSSFQKSNKELPIAFGRTISNEIFVADLSKMPHLLMAGATGQGKSVGLNVIITSLLYKKHPSQVKFVLVDPKKVELTLYQHIEKHFLAKLPDEGEAIITDTSKVIDTLNSLCAEMDQRYDLLKQAQVRNIKEYNQKFLKRRLNPENGHRFLPYIVLVIDELADLMMTAGKEVETPIARLAQLARAIGIHLIIATQRPSVNIITGIIKANFPTRLAFRVTSKVDSRTILDTGGADQLVGRGDMLYSEGGEPIRVQCAFVDTPEVEEICEFIGQQQGYAHAFYLPEVDSDEGGGNGGAGGDPLDDIDPLFDDAARTIVQNQMGSTSLLQRRLKLGYNRAGRLIDQLERAGIVGQHEGSKARDVLIPDEYALEQFLSDFHSKNS